MRTAMYSAVLLIGGSSPCIAQYPAPRIPVWAEECKGRINDSGKFDQCLEDVLSRLTRTDAKPAAPYRESMGAPRRELYRYMEQRALSAGKPAPLNRPPEAATPLKLVTLPDPLSEAFVARIKGTWNIIFANRELVPVATAIMVIGDPRQDGIYYPGNYISGLPSQGMMRRAIIRAVVVTPAKTPGYTGVDIWVQRELADVFDTVEGFLRSDGLLHGFVTDRLEHGPMLMFQATKANVPAATLPTGLSAPNAPTTPILSADRKGISVAGRITDSSSGLVANGALVLLGGIEHSAVTDDNGNYHISNVPPGTYTLVVKRIGYSNYTVRSVTITRGTALTINAALEPIAFREE